eukprot:5308406-Amphidinium_carterae.1
MRSVVSLLSCSCRAQWKSSHNVKGGASARDFVAHAPMSPKKDPCESSRMAQTPIATALLPPANNPRCTRVDN